VLNDKGDVYLFIILEVSTHNEYAYVCVCF